MYHKITMEKPLNCIAKTLMSLKKHTKLLSHITLVDVSKNYHKHTLIKPSMYIDKTLMSLENHIRLLRLIYNIHFFYKI